MSAGLLYLVGVGGQARSGKDTLGAYLVDRLNGVQGLRRWEQRGFAESVKRMFMDVFGVDAHFVETWKTVAEPPPGFQMPVRACLTLIGDGFRQMRPTVWIDNLFRELRLHSVITDVRYVNEVQSIRERSGSVILLYRPGFENDLPSSSEQELVPFIRRLRARGVEGPVRVRGIPCDYFLVNDGSLEELYRKADEYILADLIGRVRRFLGMSDEQ